MDQQITLPAEVRARIIEAAEHLYNATGRERFPTVAEVRRQAKTDMNAASTVVREWKRQQTVKPAPVAVAVPETVQQAMSETLAHVWTAAQEAANASLRAAQAAWDEERRELVAAEQEMGSDYQRLEQQLEAAQALKDESLLAREHAIERCARLSEQLEQVRAEAAQQGSRAEQAEARAEEIEHRAADLKEELQRAHAETASVRDQLNQAREAHHAEIEQLKTVAAQAIEQARQELASIKGKAEATQEAQAAQIEKAQAQAERYREEAEALRAQLATVTAQAAAAEALHQEQKQGAAKEAHRQAERYTALQAKRDALSKEAAQARESAASLGGKLEAVLAQNAALLSRLSQ